MSAVCSNSGVVTHLRDFAAFLTWGFSPAPLGEKAQTRAEGLPVSDPKSAGLFSETPANQRLTVNAGICHGLPGKGGGRAKAVGRGLRQVSSARTNRKSITANARVPHLRMSLFAVIILIVAAPTFAATHPVPLEPNTDAKKCL